MTEVLAPSVTVVIPTLNGMPWLHESLDAFLNQEYPGRLEFLLIDSGSTDGTKELQKRDPRIRVHQIPADQFGHGRTRNLASTLSNSELILLTVQDASPRNDRWILAMVNALLKNQLDAICGGQAAPHRSSVNPLERYRPVNEAQEVIVVDGDAFSQWSKQEQLQNCGWDNVNSLYRRRILLKQPFADVRFGEDMLWAKSWLRSGGRIGYAYHCKVWHYHHYDATFARKREISVLYWQYKVFEVLPTSPTPPSITLLLRTLKATLRAEPLDILHSLYWMRYNWVKARCKTEAYRDVETAISNGGRAIHELYDSMGPTSPMNTKFGKPKSK